jgi:hypothetical protein
VRQFALAAAISAALASAAAAAPVVYTAHLSAEGRAYTVVLAFQPEESEPTAEVMWEKQSFPSSVEFGFGSYGGKTRCTANAEFKIGTASMMIVDDATRAVERSWKETAPAVLDVQSEDWSGAADCGIDPGPLPKSAYFFVEGPLVASVQDSQRSAEPIVSVEAQVARHIVLDRQRPEVASAGDRNKLVLRGLDASEAPNDFGAIVTRRRWLPWLKKWTLIESETVEFRRQP